MAIANPYQQYKQQSIYTMTPQEMLLLLYDELVKRMHLAIKAIESSDFETANKHLLRAQDIVRYLSVTLKDGYEISENLDKLYDYFLAQLVAANMKKDAQLVAEVLTLVEELRDAWRQAEKLSRAQ
jgi:flagellar protein FliS